jgi:TetR/AcrR family transcriptional repressor of mexJK operon
MESPRQRRSASKRKAILEAAADAFLTNGYDGTSMDDVATRAAVSKPTVYKYFADKERLFAAIVLATTDQVVALVRLIGETLAETDELEQVLTRLARRLITTLMEPRMVRLRRLIIANAERFPDVGRAWYENGFERVLAALAGSFRELAQRGLLDLEDPLVAADHFVGLLLWIPLNQAMFTGRTSPSRRELDTYARAAVGAFLDGYGVRADTSVAPRSTARRRSDHASASRSR